MPKRQFTRKEIYDLVWSKPQKKLALELNIKESLLRKICKEYNIPTPKAGHWKKLEYNKDVIVEKLTTFNKWENKLIDIEKFGFDFKDGYKYRLSNRIKEIESQHPKESRVPQKLTRPDLLVQKAKIYLDKKKSSKWKGFEDQIHTASGFLSISVTKRNVPRTLRFIDSFIKLLGKRAHQIEISEWDTIVIINEERFKIKFREKCNRIAIQQNSWTTNELVPNGKLSVKLVHPYNTKEWQDGSKKLEQQLSKIVAALELRADKEKLERAKINKYWAEQKRLQAIKDKEEIRKHIEERKIEMLLDHSAKWKVAQDLNLFITRIETKYNYNEPSSNVSCWLNWAKSLEKSLNPISGNVEEYVEQYDTKGN